MPSSSSPHIATAALAVNAEQRRVNEQRSHHRSQYEEMKSMWSGFMGMIGLWCSVSRANGDWAGFPQIDSRRWQFVRDALHRKSAEYATQRNTTG
jgi:hypothetical protein